MSQGRPRSRHDPRSVSKMSSTPVSRASETLRNVTSAGVKEQQVRVENGQVAEYQVNLLVTFVLE